MIKRNLTRLAAVGLVASPLAAMADAPIDFTATGTTLAGYVATAAGAGLGIFAAVVGVGICVRAFKKLSGK